MRKPDWKHKGITKGLCIDLFRQWKMIILIIPVQEKKE